MKLIHTAHAAVILLLSCSNSFAVTLTESQEEVRQIAEEVANNNCINEFCFTKTLQAIAWQESSFGINIIGDRSPNKVLHEFSLGAFQIKVQTAKRVIKHFKKTEYYNLTNDEFVKLLLENNEFGALIAVHYLILNYNYAKSKGYNNPYRYAVSRYNGGANNITYINKILDKINALYPTK